MTVTYLDTSAAMKLLVDEPESDALLHELTTTARDLVASWLRTPSCTALPDETPA